MTLPFKRLKIAVVGLGRTGLKNHLVPLGQLNHLYEIRAVADPLEPRREELRARFQCEAYGTLSELLESSDAEWVVLTTPQTVHHAQTLQALRAGRHVVCEKPMALDLGQAREMETAALEERRHLAVFHNRRYAPDFLKVREVVRSGKLGRLLMVKISLNQFGRRWDWQTLRKFGGGLLANYGPHALDQALTFLDTDCPGIVARLERAVTLGDAEDHVKLIVHAPGHPLVDIELSSADAFPEERWKIYGTAGGLHGTEELLQWRFFDPERLPPRTVSETPSPDRRYDQEAIPWVEECWRPGDAPEALPMAAAFYTDLFQAIARGEPPPIGARQALAVMALIGQAAARPI